MSQPRNSRENSLRNWLPSTSLSSLRQEMSDVMESFFGDSLTQLRGEPMPRIDISETADAVEITTDLPGFNAEDVQLEVGEKTLLISGKHQEQSEDVEEGRKFHRLERRTGSFSRTIWLPCPVDEERIDALLSNGVLKIHLPKREEARRRKVEVKGGTAAPPAPQS